MRWCGLFVPTRMAYHVRAVNLHAGVDIHVTCKATVTLIIHSCNYSLQKIYCTHLQKRRRGNVNWKDWFRVQTVTSWMWNVLVSLKKSFQAEYRQMIFGTITLTYDFLLCRWCCQKKIKENVRYWIEWLGWLHFRELTCSKQKKKWRELVNKT